MSNNECPFNRKYFNLLSMIIVFRTTLLGLFFTFIKISLRTEHVFPVIRWKGSVNRETQQCGYTNISTYSRYMYVAETLSVKLAEVKFGNVSNSNLLE